ncbi:MAG TPA: YeaH/YhbH family protein [Edaphobacter sp.]
MDIIDRRVNPHGKNLENRRRVIERAREAVTEAVRSGVNNGSLREVGHEQAVTVPSDRLHEPTFRTIATGGVRSVILTGNKEFSAGDRLKRESGSGGAGNGSGAGSGDSGGGEDEFRFVLTREEFLNLFFDDLELPDLVKQQIVNTDAMTPARAGFSVDGNPSRLDMARTMRQSMARRIGLRRPKNEELDALEEDVDRLQGGDPAALHEAEEALARARARMRRVPWVDPVDLRYRRYTQVPKPSARAVMFCLMDVSGSMSETMKDLAKRFFLLLYVFLERRYRKVELVFIRHTETAEEVDEETFFTDPRTGSTVVSTALVEMLRIQRDRYPSDSWNIYAAQASDGDNFGDDSQRAAALLEHDILPLVQHFAYIEVAPSAAIIRGETDLWRGYEPVTQRDPKLAMRRVATRGDIFPVFRDLFGKRPTTAD